MQAAADLCRGWLLSPTKTMYLEHTAGGLAWAQKILAKEAHKQSGFSWPIARQSRSSTDRQARVTGTKTGKRSTLYHEDLTNGTTVGEYVPFEHARADFEKVFEVSLPEDFDSLRNPLPPGLQRPLCIAKSEGVLDFLNKLRVVLDFFYGVTAAGRWEKLWTDPADASDNPDTVLEELKYLLNPYQKKPQNPVDCYLTVKVEGEALVGLLRLEEARDVSYPHRDKASLAHPCAFNNLQAWRNLIRRQARFIEYNLELSQLNVNITDRDGKIDRKEIRGKDARFQFAAVTGALESGRHRQGRISYDDGLRRFAHISPGGDVLTDEAVIVRRVLLYPGAEVVPPEPTPEQ
ncbi:hypothetical protein LTR27_003346 [Elasticomyces elasticus]|nr:hypothetical protein LTR27_003346 [Elasticomyces elasticus]